MFMLKKAALIGVDVGTTAIKMVELARIKTGLRLEHFAVVPLEAGIITDGLVTNPEALRAAIEKCHTKLDSKIKSVALNIPIESVFIKRLRVSTDIVQGSIELEVARQLSSLMSIDITEIHIDFQIFPDKGLLSAGHAVDVNSSMSEIGEFRGKDDKVEILAMAAKKDKIEERMSFVEDIGLKAVVVDSDSFSMHTVLDELYTREGKSIEDKNFALVNVGEHKLTLVVLRNGEAIYTRDADFGMGQLLSDVVMQYGLTEIGAKQVIDGEALPPDGYEALLSVHVESATQEVHRSMQLFMTSTAYVSVEEVYLHGEQCHIQGLSQSISNSLGVACEVLNPFRGLEISASAAKEIAKYAPTLVVACGLAYRRFDL